MAYETWRWGSIRIGRSLRYGRGGLIDAGARGLICAWLLVLRVLQVIADDQRHVFVEIFDAAMNAVDSEVSAEYAARQEAQCRILRPLPELRASSQVGSRAIIDARKQVIVTIHIPFRQHLQHFQSVKIAGITHVRVGGIDADDVADKIRLVLSGVSALVSLVVRDDPRQIERGDVLVESHLAREGDVESADAGPTGQARQGERLRIAERAAAGVAYQRFVLKSLLDHFVDRLARRRRRTFRRPSRQVVVGIDAGDDLQPDGFKFPGARRSAVEAQSLRQRQSLVIQSPKRQKDWNQDAR